MPTILLPTPLRPFANKQKQIPVTGDNVQSALTDLVRQFPDLRPHLFDEHGTVRGFINVYVNSQDVRSLQALETSLVERDEVSLIPSIAGGLT